MDFMQAKNKSLEEIINQSDDKDIWAETSFMKLIDAKIGAEVSQRLLAVNKDMQTATDKIIKSNEGLAKSNEKYTRSLCWLTGGLVFVGLLQFLALMIPLIRK